MPTAVGPNKKGEENLVFGFDLGDAHNSYKGEPTTPLRDAFPTDTALPTGYHWTYEYGFEIVDAPVSNHFLSKKKWIKGVRDTTGSRRILFLNYSFTSGSTYTFSCYMYSNDSRLTSIAQVSHNGAYSDYQSGIEYTSADRGKVKRIHGTWVQQQNGSSIFGMQTNNAALGATFYMTGLQVEENSKPTRLTTGHRSHSGSLMDLRKEYTMDTTNASFDSKSQLTFDGTGDYVEATAATNITDSITLEAVFKEFSGTAPHTTIICTDRSHQYGVKLMSYKNYNRYGLWLGFGTSSYVAMVDATLNNNVTYHLVGTWERSSGVVKIYLNGELTGTINTGQTSAIALNDGKITLGRDYHGFGSSYGLNGDIYLGKVYDRVLTAEEIKANFNAVKSRFNI